MRQLRIALLTVLLGTICAGPALADSHLGQGAASDAKIVDFGFSPDKVELTAGDRIEWTNTGDRPHTVTDRGGTFDTGPIAPNAKDSVTFSVPGRYTFFCRINPGKMNGVIEVKVGAELPKALRIEATDPTRDTSTPLSFTPNELEVEAGTPVVLANVGGKPHSLTADDGSFNTGIVAPGAGGGRFAGTNETVVPTKPGEFPFSCAVHPEAMKGVLTVTGEASEGPSKGASAAPNDTSIDIKDFEFDPAEASVAPGGTVTWRNTGQAQHTATFDPEVGEPLDTGTIEPGADDSLVAPTQPGSYSYRCTVHPAKMRGTLVVVGQGTADPTKANVEDEYQATAGGGPGGGISALALATAVAGAFLGGFGVSAFVRRKPSPPAQTP
jgi:plastocyanin